MRTFREGCFVDKAIFMASGLFAKAGPFIRQGIAAWTQKIHQRYPTSSNKHVKPPPAKYLFQTTSQTKGSKIIRCFGNNCNVCFDGISIDCIIVVEIISSLNDGNISTYHDKTCLILLICFKVMRHCNATIMCTHRQISNISRTKSQNLNASHFVFPLSLRNPLTSGVKSITKM